MKIITADQRISEKRGAKILIVGPTGVGKTSLLRTLDPAHTLFIDVEAGDLAVLDVPVDTVRIQSDVPPSRDAELIPHNTLATIQMRIRPGNAGENGLLKRSRDGACEMLDVEFVVVDGPHTKRKFWENMILAGTTDGHETASKISRGKLRSILESSRGIRSDDMSATARAARTVELADFNDMLFVAKIGIEKGKTKNDGSGDAYPDKNILAAIITPEKKDWHPVEQSPPFNGGGRSEASSVAPAADNAKPVAKPTWAS